MNSSPANPSKLLKRYLRSWGAKALALAGVLVLLLPQLAFAHLGLRRSSPTDGAHLAAAPRELRLTFTEAVQPAFTRLRLIGPSGSEVPLSSLRQPLDSGQIILVEVSGPLEAGGYKIEWQVVGKDAHPVRGTILYVVAPGATGLEDPAKTGESTGASALPHHDPTSMPSGDFGAESPGYVAIRALQFTALLVVIGALAFSFVVLGLLRRTETDADVVASMRIRAAGVGVWATFALLGTAILRLYMQSLAMHGQGDALNRDFVGPMLANTVWGWGWLLQLVGVLIAIVGFRMAAHGRASGWKLTAVAGIGLAITPALSGHAAATPGLAGLAIAADALHVVGAAGWLGSLLFVLAVGIPLTMQLEKDRRGAAVARLVNAFSPTALMFAGLAALTGVFAAWLHIGFSSAIWTSDYGRILLIKLAILSVVLGTGAYNWLKVRPALGDTLGAKRMQRSAAMELTVGVLVVIVTAVLVATPPPMDMARDSNTGSETSSTRD